MSDEVKSVVLEMFPNEFIAEVVVGFLKDAGIAAFVEGENLQDPVASAERSLGSLTVRVFVEEKRLEEAREVLAAARAAGSLVEEEDASDD
ncbi:MAG: DUF2007 domain-containing protein [Planctomycetota bacterium]